MQNILFSFGSLFFSLLLTIVYFIKAKQTKIDNKIFKYLLVLLNLTIFSEIIAVSFIYYFPNNVLIGNILARINWILTISWIMNIACYILTIGMAYKIENYKEFVSNNKDIKMLLYIYVVSIIISLFIEFSNFSNSKGAYISGPALYFMYFVGFVVILISIVGVIKSKKVVLDGKVSPLVIGITVCVIAMILQRIFPMYLIITSMFTFETYIIYFMFENPDLYLIKELEYAKKKAENSNKSKTDFLSNMSHEIRTPMNAILGFSEGILLEKEFDSNTAKKDISNILLASSNLLEIINNILDISKIETGEEKINNKEYNFENVFLELKSIVESKLNSDKVKFITEIDPKIPSKLIGDKTKVFQVLLNILSNSVKYTEVGRITLKVTSDIYDNKVSLHFVISDTGYGIKKEDYDKMFEKFSRLDIATQKEIEGTGLGLLITKRLVNLLEGKIWFESYYGAGTTFYVDIVQTIADSSEIGNVFIKDRKEKQKTYLDCSNYKVLLVDDNNLNLKVAKKLLSNYNFQITCLNNGKDCIKSIKEKEVYDLIFLDHMMPEMDGIEVLHTLKKLKNCKLPPIIVLTANAINNVQEMYLKEGFDEYLSKPINTAELDKVINKYLNN